MGDIAQIARRFLPSVVFDVARRIYIRAERRRYVAGIREYQKHVVTHRYGRVTLDVVLADPLAEEWYDHDWEELEEIRLLERGRLGPGARVFDLGAHQGVVAAMLSHVVGSGGHVVAVDPNPHNATVMRETLAANAIDNVKVVEAAVGSEPGTAHINYRLNTRLTDAVAARDAEHEVRVTTIDELASQHGTPEVIFLDVEGFEARALRGATATLASGPDCFVEVHVGCGLEDAGDRVDDVLEAFPATRYRRYARSDEREAFEEIPEAGGSWPSRFFLVALGRRADAS